MSVNIKKGLVVWITGLAGSGKTTIAQETLRRTRQEGETFVFIDGDEHREIFTQNAGYSLKERLEVAKKRRNLCKFLSNQGINVITTAVCLTKDVYEHNRTELENYQEVYIHCDMDSLIKRDKKGLYSGALNGAVKDVVGIDIPFEAPQNADLIIENSQLNDLSSKSARVFELIMATL